jgi:hypothetical protein
MMGADTRAAIEEHWRASEIGDTLTEHAIYADDLWVSEVVITYDGSPTHSVSIMEFADGHVVHETQYFADPFVAPAWRKALAQ